MKRIKNFMCAALAAIVLLSQMPEGYAQSYYGQNFADFDGSALPEEFEISDVNEDSGRGAQLDFEKTETDEGEGAVLLTAGAGDFDPYYSPAMVLTLPEQISGYITLGMDINVKSASGGDSVFAINAAGAENFFFDYTGLVFNADGACGAINRENADFEFNKWYRLELVFNFEQKQYKANLIDKASGAKTVIVELSDLANRMYATGLEIVEFSLLSSASVAVANIEIADAAEPAQITPKVVDAAYILPDLTEVKRSEWTDGKINYSASTFRIYFNTELDEDTLSGVYVRRGSETIAAGTKYNAESKSVDIALPALSAGESYEAVISQELLSLTGAKANEQTIGFTVASRELELDAPADGAVIDDGAIACQWRFPGEFTKMLLMIDGKTVVRPEYSKTGSYSAMLNENDVSYGAHTLSVYAVDKSGKEYSKDIQFTAVKSKETATVYDYNTWDGTIDTCTPKFNPGIYSQGVTSGIGLDGSKCFKTVLDLNPTNSNEAAFNVNMTGSPAELTTEFDFFCGEDGGVKLKREIYAGKNSDGVDLWDIYTIAEQSCIGDKLIGDGDWHRIKIVDAFASGRYTVYVDGESASSGVLKYDSATRAKICLFSQVNSNVEILIDNLVVTESEQYAQPSSTAYIIGGKEYSGASGVGETAESIKQYFTKGFDADSIGTDSVSLYCGNDEVKLKSAFYNSGDNSIVVVPGRVLTPGSVGRLVVSDSVRFSDKVKPGRSFEVEFDIVSDGFGVRTFSLDVNGKSVSKDFVNAGDYPCGKVGVFNNSDESKKITVVMSFYLNGALVGIKSETVDVAPGSSESISLENNSVPYEDNMLIKITAIDSWTTRGLIAFRAF